MHAMYTQSNSIHTLSRYMVGTIFHTNQVLPKLVYMNPIHVYMHTLRKQFLGI